MKRILPLLRYLPWKAISSIALMLIGGTATTVETFPEVFGNAVNLRVLGVLLVGIGIALFVTYIGIALMILGGLIVGAVIFFEWPPNNLIVAAILIGAGFAINRR